MRFPLERLMLNGHPESEGEVFAMHVKKNIGIINALIRITAGLTLLSWYTARLARRPWRRRGYFFIILLAANQVAEGIVRYCPITDLAKKGWAGGFDRKMKEWRETISRNFRKEREGGREESADEGH